jgi:hypothetical protein
MLCDECGAKIDEGCRFCGECGAPARAKTREIGGEQAQGLVSGRARGAQARGARGRETRRSEGRPAQSAVKTTLAGVAPAEADARARAQVERPRPPRHTDDDERTNPALDPATRRRIEALAKAARDGDSVAESPPENSEFQRLLDEVENGFEAILSGQSAEDPALAPTAENVFDEQQAKQLFQELVVANARDIRDFMIELRLGEPNVAWIDYVRPSIRAILRSAEGMGHVELVKRLRSFADALDETKARTQGLLEGEPSGEQASVPVRDPARQALIDAYGELVVFLPDAFALEAESNRREAGIVAALLEQALDERGLALERVRASGLASLAALYVSRPAELAEQARIEPELAERLAGRMSAYRREVWTLLPEGARGSERERLARAVRALERAHRDYEATEPCSTGRREARRRRRAALTAAALWLARLGRCEELRSLETRPFDARLEILASVLEDLERRAAGQLPGRAAGNR